MADEIRSGLELPEYGVENPAPLSKVNPTEITTTFKEPADKIMQAREDYARALEERFRKPNWWKVMAGFAKPQLGGFVASLGSAGEALGEYEAQKRMVGPTVARLRAENAAQELAMAQGIKAANIQSDAAREGRMLTGPQAGQVASLTQGPAAAATAAQNQFQTNLNAAWRDFQANMSIEELRRKYPDEVVRELMSRNYIPSSSQFGAPSPAVGGGVGAPALQQAPAAPAGAASEPQSAGRGFVPGVPTEKINESVKASGLPADEQNTLRQAEYNSAIQARNDFTNTLGNQRQAYTGVFKDAKDAYKSLADPSLSNLFAIGQGPSAGDLIVRALEGVPVGSIIAEAFKQSRPLSNEQKAKLENAILAGVKAVGTYQVANQLKNPTDAIREIEQYIPNLRSAPQETILRAFALMGSDALYKANQFPEFQRYINTKGNDARFWQSSDEIRRLNQEASQRSGSVLRDQIKVKTPDGGFRFVTPKFFEQDIGGEEKSNTPKTPTKISAQAILERAKRISGGQ